MRKDGRRRRITQEEVANISYLQPYTVPNYNKSFNIPTLKIIDLPSQTLIS